jgi:hypothetical protein
MISMSKEVLLTSFPVLWTILSQEQSRHWCGEEVSMKQSSAQTGLYFRQYLNLSPPWSACHPREALCLSSEQAGNSIVSFWEKN